MRTERAPGLEVRWKREPEMPQNNPSRVHLVSQGLVGSQLVQINLLAQIDINTEPA
jgi:hypothetical protein